MEFTKENSVAVGKIPSGLFIVTSTLEDRIDGYLGSWIQQISFRPLLITIAIRPGRPCYDFIQSHGRFCVNVVGQNNQGLMKPFWKGYDPTDRPFDTLDHYRTERRNVVMRNAMAAIECQKTQSLTPGDHELIIAEVVECHMLAVDEKPLTHVRKSGMDY